MKISNTSNTSFFKSWKFAAAVIVWAATFTPAISLGQVTKSAEPASSAKSPPPQSLDTPAPSTKPAEKGERPITEQPPLKPLPTDAAAKKGDAKATDSAPVVKSVLPENKTVRTTPAAGDATQDGAQPHATALPAGKSQPSAAAKAIQQTGLQNEASAWSPWILALTILALFVLPVMAGNYLARVWRMPDHGWKFSIVLGTLAASILICLFGNFKFGPDLAGGITLVYEVEETLPDKSQPKNAAGEAQKAEGREFMNKLIGALKKRIDPDGTKEISIREYGSSAVEIIIPQVGQDEMETVKQKLLKIGQLEFRITADQSIPIDRDKIAQAKKLPPGQKEVLIGDRKVAEWVPFDVKQFEKDENIAKRQGIDEPEALVLMDPYNVTGEYLTRSTKGLDDTGGPAVHFSFNAQGANRFEKLTGQNLPNPATGNVHRRLGIILDKTLVSAPNINDRISSEGQISGRGMTEKEVDLTVEVLNAGSLPARLAKIPIAQDVISPTLGGVTVQKGKEAITASLVGVVLFMIMYYRFSGVVASIGLALNLVMVLALMVLIKAAFTLPGLAGLALTVGMSVDTNVLIYERIREELASGAALRMAIRNGFGRAMRAIIDTHLTTIISGIVLFYVGTDQVKGFAVTLILGLVVNLFTAFFCTRVMFDVAERRGLIKELKMMHVFRAPNFDFLGIRWVALGASWVLILIGMIAVYFRGSSLLDIDFTGGSSVAFSLNEPVTLSQVRNVLAAAKLDGQPLSEKNLLVVERGTKNTEYTVVTSEQSVDAVEGVVQQEFGNKLKKYSFEYRDLKPVKDADFSGIEARVIVNSGPQYEEEKGVAHDALRDQILGVLTKTGHTGIQPVVSNPRYRKGSNARFDEWTVRIPGIDEPAGRNVFDTLQASLRDKALFPLASTIGSRVSGDMQGKAIEAVGISLVAMVIYLWLRFAKPAYGIAAGVALIHDVFVTVGALAISYYIVSWFPGFASALRIDAFQINLTIVAALLTIIGYSVNDTIVTFDRLREIKGKSPTITAKMVNDSVNQTLSRTILTVFTVFIVVVILYFFGGEGVHSFAFAFLVGIVTGTYSSVYVASPVVLWLSGVSAAPAKQEPATSVRGMQPAR